MEPTNRLLGLEDLEVDAALASPLDTQIRASAILMADPPASYLATRNEDLLPFVNAPLGSQPGQAKEPRFGDALEEGASGPLNPYEYLFDRFKKLAEAASRLKKAELEAGIVSRRAQIDQLNLDCVYCAFRRGRTSKEKMAVALEQISVSVAQREDMLKFPNINSEQEIKRASKPLDLSWDPFPGNYSMRDMAIGTSLYEYVENGYFHATCRPFVPGRVVLTEKEEAAAVMALWNRLDCILQSLVEQPGDTVIEFLGRFVQGIDRHRAYFDNVQTDILAEIARDAIPRRSNIFQSICRTLSKRSGR